MRVPCLCAFAFTLIGCGSSVDIPADESEPANDSGVAERPGDDSAVAVQDSTSIVEDTGTIPSDADPPKDAAKPCYSELWFPAAKLDAVKSAYASAKWKDAVLSALKTRYPDGFALVDAMKSDPEIDRFADASSWSALMESVDTICHEEGHGWDFDTALKTPGKHAFWMRKDLVLSAPKDLAYFARNELLSYVTDDATAQYDDTYLTGEQGTYDFIFLAEELTQYINGLACVTSVGSEVSTFGTSFRDGAASHLLYLEWYLNRARTAHSSLYAQMKSNADIQKLVRYEWARGHFWTEQSKPFKTFGIKDAQIWAKVNAKANLDEIQLFTGQSPDEVACHP